MKNLTDICTSLELSKRLYEEGVTKGYDSHFYWDKTTQYGKQWAIYVVGECLDFQSEYTFTNEGQWSGVRAYPALTMTELEDILVTCCPNIAFEIRIWPLHRVNRKFTAIAMGYEYASDCYPSSLAALESLTVWLLDNKLLSVT